MRLCDNLCKLGAAGWRLVHGTPGVWLLTLALVAQIPAGQQTAQAHKTATSPFKYNEDVFPIFRDRCGRCHFEGGPAPMSLLTYQSAYPWAVSIREELMAQRMPPWYVDPLGPPVKGVPSISAREIDKIITWAAGGTPEGDAAKKPAPVTAQRSGWRMGPPDITLAMSGDHVLSPEVDEETFEAVLPVTTPDAKWIRAADLLPGTPAIVRDAIVAIDQGPVLSVWAPDADVVEPPANAAFRIQPGAKIRLRIHYKKSWMDAQKEKSDRSLVGLYFAPDPGMRREIRALAVSESASTASPASGPVSGRLNERARILAVRITHNMPFESVDVHAFTASGRRIPLLRLHASRPEWPRRYWLTEPVVVPADSTIETVVKPIQLKDGGASQASGQPLQIALDYVVE